MSNIKISFIKKTATIDMKLTLEQMGLLEEALQHIAECTPDNEIGPIENMVEMFGFEFGEIFCKPYKNISAEPGELEFIKPVEGTSKN